MSRKQPESHLMWGVDDEIRQMAKEIIDYLNSEKVAYNPLAERWEKLKNEIEEMIFKEEEIMIPMILDVFSLKDWMQIAEDSRDIGYAFILEPILWKAGPDALAKEKEREPLRQLAIQKVRDATEEIKAGLDQENALNIVEVYDWEKET